MRDVEKVLDYQGQWQSREYKVQHRYPDHVDPSVVIVSGTDPPIHVQRYFDIPSVTEIEHLGDIPQVTIRGGWHLPRYLVLKLVINGKEFYFWE